MNDAANRAGGRGSGAVPHSFRRVPEPHSDEELETGEPIDDAPAPVKIKARAVPFNGRAQPTESAEPANGGGQMVLTTAKYMPAPQPQEPRQKGRRPAPEEEASSLEGQVLNSGKWGGMLAMAVAVIWFMAGLADDIIFFYPPVLFFIGLVSFMKGAVK